MTIAPFAIAAPMLKPFADGQTWALMSEVTYRILDTEYVITVPRGFVTDFASIPQVLWSFGLAPEGTYLKAAIIHDWLYWVQCCTRAQSDDLFKIAMQESGVRQAELEIIHEGVRFGGLMAWAKNYTERVSGKPRVIPEGYLNFGPDVLWPAYRVMLSRLKIVDTLPASNPPWCSVPSPTK